MKEINFELINSNKNEVKELERLRYECFLLPNDNVNLLNTYYAKELLNKQVIAFGCYFNANLIGGCYLSSARNSLYVEQLFIHPFYQRSNCHFGTKLLNYVLNNKAIIENYYQTNFKSSYLEALPEAVSFYKNMGYEESGYMLKKRLR